jgi:Reverse transcriptase (RNA-dependent DNA polymerase)
MPFGFFEFHLMPFGLRNAGMTFQRMMDELFFYMPCVFVYLDDLLAASRLAAEHCLHLQQILRQLQVWSLTKKSVFSASPACISLGTRCRPGASAPC